MAVAAPIARPRHTLTRRRDKRDAARRPNERFVGDLLDDIASFLVRCERLGGSNASPFLNPSWLRAWYATLGAHGGRRAVLLAVRSETTGADVLLLPLVSRRVAGLSVVEFADAGIGDYNLPAFDAVALQDDAVAADVWDAVRRALRGHDAIRLEKMLTRTLDDAGSVPNPIVRAVPVTTSELQGNQVHAHEDWDAWRYSLDKRVRKEYERCWRVFTRSPAARFERIHDPAAALRAFESLESQQSTRMQRGGRRYLLDDPPYSAAYRQALLAGLADGSVVLTALVDGEAIVATQFGIANGLRWIALRLGTAGSAWSRCSPGRLLLERTAAHLHAQGVRWFDFGIGDYAHKTVFGVTPIPLVDAVEALSWRGRPLVWRWRLRRAAKRRPLLVRCARFARRLLPPSSAR